MLSLATELATFQRGALRGIPPACNQIIHWCDLNALPKATAWEARFLLALTFRWLRTTYHLKHASLKELSATNLQQLHDLMQDEISVM